MRRILRSMPLWAFVLSSFWASAIGNAQPPGQDRGFTRKAPAVATGNERQSQTNLWVLEVQYKSLRMVRARLTDPKTGKPGAEEPVLYLVYKAINRGLGEAIDNSETTPANRFDPDVAAPLFVPEFTLISNDNGQQKIYDDVVLPEAQKAIIEQRLDREGARLKNSVEVVGPIPDPPKPGDPDPREIVGVAMWRGVDLEPDRYTILMSGFSNGYKLVLGPASYQTLVDRVKAEKLIFSDQVWDGKTKWRAASETHNLFNAGKAPPADPDANIWFFTTTPERVAEADEKPITWRRVIQQHYWRPGDNLKPQEREFLDQGDPEWIYQPDDQRAPVAPRPANATAARPGANASK